MDLTRVQRQSRKAIESAEKAGRQFSPVMYPTQPLNADAAFFFAHAGYSYGPNETPEQGRTRIALEYELAERFGRTAGLSFEWEVSDVDSSDFSYEKPAWTLYDCICRDDEGNVRASVGACDFGRDNGPYGDYRRVIEAELACEVMDQEREERAARNNH